MTESIGVSSVPAKLRIVEITDWHDAELLRPEWEMLLKASPSTSIFQSWEWVTSWWHAYGNGCDLCLLVFYDEERLVGIAPLYFHGPQHAARIRPRALRVLGDRTGDSASLDVIYVAGTEAPIAESIAVWLLRNRARWDSFEMESVLEQSRLRAILDDKFKAQGWIRREYRAPHLFIVLPRSWDEFVARLSRLSRRNVRYARRVLNNKFRSVQARRCQTEEELPYFLESLYKMHSDRWQIADRKGVFTSPARRTFFEQASRRLLRSNRLWFWLLEVDGQPVSMQFSTRLDSKVNAIQTGWNPDFARYSVGLVLWSHVIEEAIREGILILDLGEGENPYKIGWSAERRSFVTTSWFRPKSRGEWLLRKHEFLDHSRESARKMIPAPVWTFVRAVVRRFIPYRNPIEEPEITQ
jgi:CelD/BcsL family acetyltransferase involved in cellulose biosynthesis